MVVWRLLSEIMFLVTIRMAVALVVDAGELLAAPRAPVESGTTRQVYLELGLLESQAQCHDET